MDVCFFTLWYICYYTVSCINMYSRASAIICCKFFLEHLLDFMTSLRQTNVDAPSETSSSFRRRHKKEIYFFGCVFLLKWYGNAKWNMRQNWSRIETAPPYKYEITFQLPRAREVPGAVLLFLIHHVFLIYSSVVRRLVRKICWLAEGTHHPTLCSMPTWAKKIQPHSYAWNLLIVCLG